MNNIVKKSFHRKYISIIVLVLFIGISVIPLIEGAKSEEYMFLNQDPPCYPCF